MLIGAHRTREICACCGDKELVPALSFPPTPLANEFVLSDRRASQQEHFPLDVVLCDNCGHLQMGTLVDPSRMFQNYVYATGTSPVTVKHFDDYAQAIVDRFGPSFVFEVGSNDGTLLRSFQKRGVGVRGIDPAVGIAARATLDGIPTIPAFFTDAMAQEVLRDPEVPKVDVVIANNVFAHAEDLLDIALGVRSLIGNHGVFVFEVSYLLDIIEQMTFDTIYHEHFSYHSLGPLQVLLGRAGMDVFDVERTPGQIGRGSIRVFARAKPIIPPVMSHIRPSVAEIMALEEAAELGHPETYAHYESTIQQLGWDLRDRLERLSAEGKTIVGYGAPAKLTTLMYAFGLDPKWFSYVVEDAPLKQGLFTPGHHLPVHPPSRLVLDPPDFVVIFAWNFAGPIIQKIVAQGVKTRCIVPLPKYFEATTGVDLRAEDEIPCA